MVLALLVVIGVMLLILCICCGDMLCGISRAVMKLVWLADSVSVRQGPTLSVLVKFMRTRLMLWPRGRCRKVLSCVILCRVPPLSIVALVLKWKPNVRCRVFLISSWHLLGVLLCGGIVSVMMLREMQLTCLMTCRFLGLRMKLTKLCVSFEGVGLPQRNSWCVSIQLLALIASCDGVSGCALVLEIVSVSVCLMLVRLMKLSLLGLVIILVDSRLADLQ